MIKEFGQSNLDRNTALLLAADKQGKNSSAYFSNLDNYWNGVNSLMADRIVSVKQTYPPFFQAMLTYASGVYHTSQLAAMMMEVESRFNRFTWIYPEIAPLILGRFIGGIYKQLMNLLPGVGFNDALEKPQYLSDRLNQNNASFGYHVSLALLKKTEDVRASGGDIPVFLYIPHDLGMRSGRGKHGYLEQECVALWEALANAHNGDEVVIPTFYMIWGDEKIQPHQYDDLQRRFSLRG